MRKQKLVLVILFLILFTVSCKGISDNEEQQSDQPTVTEAAKSEEQSTAVNLTEKDKNGSTIVNIDTTENIASEPVQEEVASGNTADTPIYYLDETSVDLTKFQTMDVSELYDMETFTFDVPADLNTTPDEKYASINDLYFIYTSDDVVMMNGEKAMEALHMGMPSDTKLQNSEYYDGKSDAELADMVKEFIKGSQGKEAYDIQLTEQNGYKILSYKYVGNAVGNSNINGHIYIFYMDENKIKTAEEKGEDMNKYLDKYVELTYYSPQSEISSTNDPLKEEVEAFDEYFDHMVESIKLK